MRTFTYRLDPLKRLPLLAWACTALALGGCMLGPDYQRPPVALDPQWQAPLPHGGSVSGLQHWWQQFNDPALTQLLRMAEADSPSMDQAWANIAQARATLGSREADAWPQVKGQYQVGRGGQRQGEQKVGGSGYAKTLDASWELDLFGKLRRNNEAGQARLEARVDDWHDARVSLAAQVANDYVQYRGCQLLSQLYADQLRSQQATADATRQSLQAGLISSADAALADASAASSQSALIEQQSQCQLLVKSLVALTGGNEPRLRSVLDAAPARLPQPAQLQVTQIPADLIRQRPDIASREREMAAANAEIGVAKADRLPSLSLVGTFTAGAQIGQANRSWTLGPSISLPLLDGGRRLATQRGAEAVYAAAVAAYRQTLRTGVMEVEQALVRLDASGRREASAERASAGYQASFEATDRNWQAGNASLLDRETARRQALEADIQRITLQQDQVRDWINLYKALGGGWQPDAPLARQPSSLPGGGT